MFVLRMKVKKDKGPGTRFSAAYTRDQQRFKISEEMAAVVIGMS